MRLKHLLGPLPNVSSSALVTLIFLIFFAALCWYVYRKERKAVYKYLESLPLTEENNER